MLLETSAAYEADLREKLQRALRRESAWGNDYGEVFAKIRDNGLNAFLFGGTVRDIALNGPTHRPRDLDIVFDQKGFDAFCLLFEAGIKRRNRFGGIKCSYRGIEIDAWPLHRTWAIAKGLAPAAGFEILPGTAFFNLDAIVAEIAPVAGTQRRIFERDFYTGVRSRTIDCILDKTDFPDLNIVRGFVLAKGTGFSFSNQFCRFVTAHLKKRTPEEIESLQFEHYRKVRIPGSLIAETVMAIQEALAANRNSEYSPVFPPAEHAAQLEFEIDPDPAWLADPDADRAEVAPKHLFISYAVEDSVFATWLARKLSARGHFVWFDRLKLLGGEPWPQTIDLAIKQHTFRMVALLSRHSIAKQKPTGERVLAQNIAQQRGILDFLIPLRVDNSDLDWLNTTLSYISFSHGWAEGWKALVKKLDAIAAPRSLPGPLNLAASTLPRGDDLLSRNGETLFTNLIRIRALPEILFVSRVTQALSSAEVKELADIWPHHIISSDTLVSLEEPPKSFANKIRITPERCLWSACEQIRGVPARSVAARLIMATIGRRLLNGGCLPHPNERFRGSYYMPALFNGQEKLSFVGYTGRKTWIQLRGRVTFRRGVSAREVNYHHFGFRIRLVRGFDTGFFLQIAPTISFFDETGRPILDKSVGTRRRRMTKMWWNDKWLNRLLAAKHIVTSLANDDSGIVLDPNLLTLASPIGIREEAFSLEDIVPTAEPDTAELEVTLEDGESLEDE